MSHCTLAPYRFLFFFSLALLPPHPTCVLLELGRASLGGLLAQAVWGVGFYPATHTFSRSAWDPRETGLAPTFLCSTFLGPE